MNNRASIYAFFIVAIIASPESYVSAQTEDPLERAREAFIRASQAAEEERWADALDGFEEAYLLSGVPTALYNTAMVLRAIGRHRDSRNAFIRLLEEHPDYTGREEAERLRDEEAARVAVLELVGLDPEAEYIFRLDGRRVDVPHNTSTELETDAGDHHLEAQREGYEIFSWDGSIRDGQRQTIEVLMQEIRDGDRPLRRNPILWIVTGLAVAGAATFLAIYLPRQAQLEPSTDNVARVD